MKIEFGKNHTFHSRRALVFSLLVAVLSFAYFFLTYRYYEAPALEITGRSSAPIKAELYLDTGNGFTAYEHFPLDVKFAEGSAGDFKIAATLPNMPLSQIRVEVTGDGAAGAEMTGAKISWSGGERRVRLEDFKSPSGPLDISNARLHRGLVLLQLSLAAFLGWLAYLLGTLPDRLEKLTWRETIRGVFIEEERWFFWSVFLGATAVHSLWLVAYWPGATSNDSWSTLNDVYRLSFTDWHPYVYSIYTLYLLQFFRSVASPAFFQILVTAGLGAWILWYCRRCGVRFLFLVPFSVYFILSIPIGLMNIILWKDIPFSIAVFAISFFLFKTRLVNETERRPARIPDWTWLPLALTLVLLLHSRHNGIMFYLLLPVFFWRQLSRRDFAALCGFLVLCYGSVRVAIPRVYDIAMTKGSVYHELRTALAIMTAPTYFSETREEDIKAMERFTQKDWKWISETFPKHWFYINDLPAVSPRHFSQKPYDDDGFNQAFLRRLILQNIPIVMAARTFDFFHSIGVDSPHSDKRNDFFENPFQLQGTNLGPPGYMRFGVSFASGSPFPRLAALAEKINSWCRQYDGLNSPVVWIWNLVIFYVLFLLAIFFERGVSAISLYTLPSLAASAGVFILGAGESWRYFYYVYLAGIFLVPLWLAYRARMKK